MFGKATATPQLPSPQTVTTTSAPPAGPGQQQQQQQQPKVQQKLQPTVTVPKPLYVGPRTRTRTAVVVQDSPDVQDSQTCSGLNFDVQLYWSIFALIFCGVVFGLIGLLLSLTARRRFDDHNYEGAKVLGQASVIVSCVGIAVGFFFLVFFLCYFL